MYIAADADALRKSFHDVLDQLEKTKFEASVATFEDLYRFLLLPGVLLLALDALLLALLGTYGLLAQSVARRRRELGIRMAVGARGRDVIRMVLGEAGALAAAGAALGVAAALAATRLLSSVLWSVQASDPLTFIAVTLLVMLAALIAAALPARRAARIDPARTLRSD
jgi:putative ABC transport system permease protein